MPTIDKESAIRASVNAAVHAYATGFEARHLAEKDNPNGTINMKVHNPFIAALGPEVQYYSSLVRSLDSSLGDMLEELAIAIAGLSYTVSRKVEGPLTSAQTTKIALLLEEYKRRSRKPAVTDYTDLRTTARDDSTVQVRHESDYHLEDAETGKHHLIELKIGGDLDNKKARSEKEALLEQYAILCNTLGSTDNVLLHFATAYNRFGDGAKWQQGRVLQYFSADELLIGRDFWNFICKMDTGYAIIMDEYKRNASAIIDALDSIRATYLST